MQPWHPTIVVGLTRGGLTPASMISHALSVPMCSLDVSLRDNNLWEPTSSFLPEEIVNGHRILVVDDINDTGATFEWIRDDWSQTLQHLPQLGDAWPQDHIRFAVLVHNDASTQPSDFVGMHINKQEEPSWVDFPWETWHT